MAAGMGIAIIAGTTGVWMGRHWITYKGVPLSIILQFIRDPIARNAYFDKNRPALHDRLNAMGIEEQIKAYYRPQMPSEKELDRYIHQLMYDNTGYLGQDYKVDSQGRLSLKFAMPAGFWDWFNLAKRLNVATDHETKDDVLYITTPEGQRVEYTFITRIYPLEDLKQQLQVESLTP
jgi:hypothetical protein